jgi:hypothetical protein
MRYIGRAAGCRAALLALCCVLATGCDKERARRDEPRSAGDAVARAPDSSGPAYPKGGPCDAEAREVTVDELLAAPARYDGVHIELRGAEVVTQVTRNIGPAARRWLRRQMRGEEGASEGERSCIAVQKLVPIGREPKLSEKIDLSKGGAAAFCRGEGCAREGYRCPVEEGSGPLDGVFHYHERLLLAEMAVCPDGRSMLAEPIE